MTALTIRVENLGKHDCGEAQFYLPGLVVSLVVAAMLVLGISYFRETEKSFADVI